MHSGPETRASHTASPEIDPEIWYIKNYMVFFFLSLRAGSIFKLSESHLLISTVCGWGTLAQCLCATIIKDLFLLKVTSTLSVSGLLVPKWTGPL